MRTLVTGGAGFIGSHLVPRLVDRGDEVVVLDRLEPQVHAGQEYTPPDGATLIVGDIGDPDIADQALEGVDAVVHLAAAVGVGQSMYEIDKFVRRNTMATATFLEGIVNRSTRPSRLVVASSMSIYGEGGYECVTHGQFAPAPRPEAQLARGGWEVECPVCGKESPPIPTAEDKPIVPTSVYAITKRDHEELALVLGTAYGIPTVALRFFNVYGPGQALSNPYTGVAAIFGSRLLNGRAPVMFEDGAQSRDFVHVTDIVSGILLALESDDAVGHAVNLGTGQPTTVEEIARILAKGLGVDIEPERLDTFRAGDIRHCFADITRASELLGYAPRVSLEDGMTDLTTWIRGQHADDGLEDANRELAARGLTSRG